MYIRQGTVGISKILIIRVAVAYLALGALRHGKKSLTIKSGLSRSPLLEKEGML